MRSENRTPLFDDYQRYLSQLVSSVAASHRGLERLLVEFQVKVVSILSNTKIESQMFETDDVRGHDLNNVVSRQP